MACTRRLPLNFKLHYYEYDSHDTTRWKKNQSMNDNNQGDLPHACKLPISLHPTRRGWLSPSPLWLAVVFSAMGWSNSNNNNSRSQSHSTSPTLSSSASSSVSPYPTDSSERSFHCVVSCELCNASQYHGHRHCVAHSHLFRIRSFHTFTLKVWRSLRWGSWSRRSTGRLFQGVLAKKGEGRRR